MVLAGFEARLGVKKPGQHVKAFRRIAFGCGGKGFNPEGHGRARKIPPYVHPTM